MIRNRVCTMTPTGAGGGGDSLLKQKGVLYAAVLSTNGNALSDVQLSNGSDVDYSHLAQKVVQEESKRNAGLVRSRRPVTSIHTLCDRRRKKTLHLQRSTGILLLCSMPLDRGRRCSCYFKVEERLVYLIVVDEQFTVRRGKAMLDSLSKKFQVLFSLPPCLLPSNHRAIM